MAANAQPAPVLEKPAEPCPSCGIELQGKFCHRCGEKRILEHELAFRHFAAHALHELTHLDAKVFATVRYLFTRPGFLTAEFLAGRRARYMKPLNLFLLAVALMFLADSIHPLSLYNMKWFSQTDKNGQLDAAWTKLAQKKHQPKELLIERIQERIHGLITAAQFVNVFAMAAFLWLFYRKRYFVEHLVMAFHFLAFIYLCTALTWPVDSFIGITSKWSLIYALVKFALFLAYLFAGLRRVYQQKPSLTLVKALAICSFLQVTFVVTPVLTFIGALIVTAKS
jgi:hypothetical protein